MQDKYIVLDKDALDKCFTTLGDLLRKRTKTNDKICELIVVGGASIVLNYGFRFTTMDIDCIDENKILMNELINKVAEKFNLPLTRINTEFTSTSSYSPKLNQYSSYFKTYGHGVLEVRTIKDEYLLAMKIVSGRKYKNDYSDIYGIIMECLNENKAITIECIEKAIIDLYGSIKVADKEAFEFAKIIINDPNSISYSEVRISEEKNAALVKAKVDRNLKQEEIEYILSKLDVK